MLFNQLVLSRILAYSCIWGHREFPKVKSIQTAAMRFFLGVGTSCPNTGLFGEMGWVPLYYIGESVCRERANPMPELDNRELYFIDGVPKKALGTGQIKP